MEADGDVNLMNEHKLTPLHMAFMGGHHDCVKLLMQVSLVKYSLLAVASQLPLLYGGAPRLRQTLDAGVASHSLARALSIPPYLPTSLSPSLALFLALALSRSLSFSRSRARALSLVLGFMLWLPSQRP